MCATPAPKEFGEVDSEIPEKTEVIAPSATWKHWRSPVYKTSYDSAMQEPLTQKETDTRLVKGCEEGRKPIYGIGRNYNTQLGVGAFRTGASIKLDSSATRGSPA